MKDVIDPLATSERITETYQRYLTSLLSLRDPVMAARLGDKVRANGQMTRGPYLDVTPPYERGATIADLVSEGVLSPRMLDISSAALPAGRPLYLHQERAIRKAAAGRSLVVATGTGSGKTESFLVPILDSLAREQDSGTLTPGVRALLLYPMNALANDQVKRLREILRDYPDITFGRYTGETLEDPAKARDQFLQLNPGVEPIPNELLSRQEMKAKPPHILLTNYAMLEYLLLRPLDTTLFDGPTGEHWRWLAVDEAHVYGGSQGAEIAMLLRRLQQRVAPDRHLQSILTSATVGDDPALVAEFATRLTRSSVEWVVGDEDRKDVVPAVRCAVPDTGSWGPLSGSDYEHLATEGDPATAILAMAAREGQAFQNAGEALSHEARLVELKNHLAQGPLTLRQIVSGLAHASWTPESLTSCVRVASSLHDDSGEPVLSARYHLFAKATEGAFTCFGRQGPHVEISRHERCPECADPMFEFGSCQRCGHVYLVGARDERDGHVWLRPNVRLGAKATWVLLDPPTGETVTSPGDEDEEVLGEASHTEYQDLWICTACSCLAPMPGTCPSCSSDRLRAARVLTRQRSEIKECLHCGSRNPDIRTFSTGNDAAAAVLSTALYQEIPASDDEVSEKSGNGRKLLLFSDSRQAAAFFSSYLEDTYARIRRRSLILNALRSEEELNIEDLASLVAKEAGALGLFERRESRQKRERTASLWVMQELLALDERQSLQGLGQMIVTLDRPPRVAIPAPLLALGLDEDEAWALLSSVVMVLLSQGAVTMPEDVEPNDEAFAPRLGPIYVRGSGSEAKRKILSWEPSRNSVTNRRIDYLRRLMTALGRPQEEAAPLLSGLWRFLADGMRDGWLAESASTTMGRLWRVDHTWLQLRGTTPESALYRCSACQRIQSVSVRSVCPTMGCDGGLEPWSLPPSSEDPDHYRALHRTVLPVGMTVREHTAQWEPKKAAAIQQEFVRGDVNVLSCSTTFELGVDVGELETVMLRNMPPSTANYVQRAGRAGRRASSAAVILTFAQRRPHDLARYQRPTEMIAGRVQAPYVYLDNDRIGRRHAHSVALSLFFRHAHQATGKVWRNAGDFFSPGDDDSGAARFVQYLTTNRGVVSEESAQILSRAVSSVIGTENGLWVDDLIALVESVGEEFRRDIYEFEALRTKAFGDRKDGLAARFGRTINNLSEQNLIGFLGQHNVLPKYGFPVDTVDLRTIFADAEMGADVRLSRDLGMAIYEYAPGAQVVAGGRLWTSGGVYRLPGRELVERQYSVCAACGHYSDDAHAVEPTCSACGHPVQTRLSYAMPVYGFVAERAPKRPGTTPPARSWFGGTYVRGQSPELKKQTIELARGQLEVAYGPRAELVTVSEGRAGRGFLLCDWCGWGAPLTAEWPKKAHTHLLKGGECRGTLRQLSLAHTFETDMLTLSGVSSFTPLLESRSVLYAVLEGASRSLDIARDDVDGALYRSDDGHASIALFDTVPGGAGNVLRIGQQLREVLKRAYAVVSTCDCGEETSCYACLRTFRNERFHDQLRRGEAKSMLASLLDEGSVTAALPDAPPNLAKPWRDALGEVQTDQERSLLLDLAESGLNIPAPMVGVEVADGIPVTFAWSRHQVAVLLEGMPEDRIDLERAGWIVPECNVQAIGSALARTSL